MKANRTIKLCENGDDPPSVAIELYERAKESSGIQKSASSKAKEPTQQPSPPATPAPEPSDPRDNHEKAEDSLPVPLEPAKVLADPIKWFGILVPWELRSAQTQFTNAVDEHVVHAVNAAKGMREIEAQIRRVRKVVKRVEKAETAVS